MTGSQCTRLAELRDHLSASGLDGFVIWRDDMFMGEEVRACDERLAMISGFTGSAGYALILKNKAVVFSDGRYHLQLETQLDDRYWQWADSTADAICTFLSAQDDLPEALKLGFDATTTSVTKSEKLPTAFGTDGTGKITWQAVAENPLDALWHDRPSQKQQPAFALDDAVTGQAASEKLAALQQRLRQASYDGIIISATDCVNWLLNIRGHDLTNTPFHLSFAFVPQDGVPVIIEGSVEGYSCVSWQGFCETLPDGRYSYDKATLPVALHQALLRDGVVLEAESCPLYLPKAKKNKTELAGFREAHIRDAHALCRFWQWLEGCDDISAYRETDLVAQLQNMRRADDSYLCDSFDTIMGAGANGAIIHYRAEEGADSTIQNDSLLLIDSGAHYKCGTTDITRTFIIGTPDDEMISAYSAVLAGHCALAMAQFPKGTNGAAIDAICRAPLWATGRDYAHGTGHGVGHILSVHEGPAHIAKRQGPPLEQGMVLSNEPGFYVAGKWGIRLENLVAVEGRDEGYLGFETLTFVPFERRLIDKAQLGEAATRWLNAYHNMIYDKLAPDADETMTAWLKEKCAPL